MKTVWSKLRLARTNRCFLLIPQLLSHHVLSCCHADNRHAVKSMVDAPHYVRTAMRAGWGIKKERDGPRKVKGHLPSDNPAADLPGYVE